MRAVPLDGEMHTVKFVLQIAFDLFGCNHDGSGLIGEVCNLILAGRVWPTKGKGMKRP
jgi:hypothetical protein